MKRQRAQQHGINYAEQRGVCANAERDGREAWVLAELTQAIAAIREDGMEPIAEALFADLFFELLDAAEFDACGALRFAG